MYCELGSHNLQVVPINRLVPVHNYEQVERVWAHDSFNLIDVGTNKDFMTRPCSAKIEKLNGMLLRCTGPTWYHVICNTSGNSG